VDNTDPHVEELEASLLATDASRSETLVHAWNHRHSLSVTNDTAHALTALPTAAAKKQYAFQHPSTAPADSTILTRTASSDARAPSSLGTTHSPRNARSEFLSPTSPPASITSSNNNNINFLLNPANTMSPSVDSSLSTAVDRRDSSSYSSFTGRHINILSNEQLDAKVETDHEIAFLLRHFAENPGYW
jgi:hypothetical protein